RRDKFSRPVHVCSASAEESENTLAMHVTEYKKERVEKTKKVSLTARGGTYTGRERRGAPTRKMCRVPSPRRQLYSYCNQVCCCSLCSSHPYKMLLCLRISRMRFYCDRFVCSSYTYEAVRAGSGFCASSDDLPKKAAPSQQNQPATARARCRLPKSKYQFLHVRVYRICKRGSERENTIYEPRIDTQYSITKSYIVCLRIHRAYGHNKKREREKLLTLSYHSWYITISRARHKLYPGNSQFDFETVREARNTASGTLLAVPARVSNSSSRSPRFVILFSRRAPRQKSLSDATLARRDDHSISRVRVGEVKSLKHITACNSRS
ncbi:unnamed protein product, partial [Trichogramma brassicae]